MGRVANLPGGPRRRGAHRGRRRRGLRRHRPQAGRGVAAGERALAADEPGNRPDRPLPPGRPRGPLDQLGDTGDHLRHRRELPPRERGLAPDRPPRRPGRDEGLSHGPPPPRSALRRGVPGDRPANRRDALGARDGRPAPRPRRPASPPPGALELRGPDAGYPPRSPGASPSRSRTRRLRRSRWRRGSSSRWSGPGLAISQAIVAGHQGTLTVESVPGEGSAFRAELPVAYPGR